MSNIVIKVENLSKQYKLGDVGTGTLSHDLNRFWHSIRGKDNPYLKIGETNDRTTKGNSEYVWSLRDINFDIQQGEAIGIIGRNGAGKSTLLKILSKVTQPTTGVIKTKGRIASLLEVGTGFHPELSGRDNIFLNGAIMGMRKQEISQKLDAIIDFAGVERYVDTPVKRYSSGMYVRLAFAVAAHLESEILIVDEVLAVGDSEFQKKCLGKMGEVSKGEGRTVLFVSHNMAAVKNLCTKGILLKYGSILSQGLIGSVIDNYFIDENVSESDNGVEIDEMKQAYFKSWELTNGTSKNSLYSRSICNIKFEFITKFPIENAELGLILRDNKGELIYSCNSRDNGGDYININVGKSFFNFSFRFPAKMGFYEIDIVVAKNHIIIDQWQPKNKIQVLSEFDSALEEKWLGIISEPLSFSFYTA